MKQSIQWTSPSNIAIVKYWGKHGRQLPMNASLSFTLSASKTETLVSWTDGQGDSNCSLNFRFEGKAKPEFEQKIRAFIHSLEPEYSWLKGLHLEIDSKNSFPHSAGIASSASAMSAFALCLMSICEVQTGTILSEEEFLKQASILSRLGSGSAARSVYPLAGLWGQTESFAGSSDQYAVPFAASLHPVFHNLYDYVFLVSKKEKAVSSRAGHQLMENHPYRLGRIAQAKFNMEQLVSILSTGDWDAFAGICEEEALTLHGLMMSSRPGFILLEPDSLNVIHALQQFRKESGVPISYTIDAGPNIHVLFPAHAKEQVDAWIRRTLPEFWNEPRILFDQVGTGPYKTAL